MRTGSVGKQAVPEFALTISILKSVLLYLIGEFMNLRWGSLLSQSDLEMMTRLELTEREETKTG